MLDGIDLSAIPDWVKPLIGVFVGWVLGTATQAWTQRRKNRRYYKAIYAELDDVHSAIATRILILKEILVTYLNGETITHLPSDIHNPIYEKHFAEVALEFTQHERFALTHIYSGLETMLRDFAIITSNSDLHSPDNAANTERLRRIIQTSEAAYINARKLDLLIHLLLREKKHHDTRAPHVEKTAEELEQLALVELRSWREAAERRKKESRPTPP